MDVVNAIGSCSDGDPDRYTYPTKLRQKNLEIFSDLGRSLKDFHKANTISEIFFQAEKIRAQLRARQVFLVAGRYYVRRAHRFSFSFERFGICVQF
jgi:hypothetical protein